MKEDFSCLTWKKKFASANCFTLSFPGHFKPLHYSVSVLLKTVLFSLYFFCLDIRLNQWSLRSPQAHPLQFTHVRHKSTFLKLWTFFHSFVHLKFLLLLSYTCNTFSSVLHFNWPQEMCGHRLTKIWLCWDRQTDYSWKRKLFLF